MTLGMRGFRGGRDSRRLWCVPWRRFGEGLAFGLGVGAPLQPVLPFAVSCGAAFGAALYLTFYPAFGAAFYLTFYPAFGAAFGTAFGHAVASCCAMTGAANRFTITWYSDIAKLDPGTMTSAAMAMPMPGGRTRLRTP